MTNITLANLASKKKQTVFNHIAEHLLTQMKTSERDNYCAYRDDNGLKCAAGCLMSDEEYDRKMECLGWLDLIVEFNVTSAHSLMIKQLQKIHDDYMPRQWKELLEEFARKNNLKFSRRLQKL